MALYLGNKEVAITNIAPLKNILLRPDAELILTYTLTHKMVEDDELTFPAYSTSSSTLLAAANLSPTITMDMDNYNYILEVRTVTIPQYNIATLAKGRLESGFGVSLFEIAPIEANTFKAITGTAKVTTVTTAVPSYTRAYHVYYSSASAIGAYAATTYGLHQVATAPTYTTAGVLTVKAPSITIRGNTTYFVNTFYNALTEASRSYIIRVYRSPKNLLNLNGWNISLGMYAILDDIYNNNYTLR